MWLNFFITEWSLKLYPIIKFKFKLLFFHLDKILIKREGKKQLSKQPKRSQMFQQLQDFNNNKWYKSMRKGSSNSKGRWCWNNVITLGVTALKHHHIKKELWHQNKSNDVGVEWSQWKWQWQSKVVVRRDDGSRKE
jgi:hypothetical protein